MIPRLNQLISSAIMIGCLTGLIVGLVAILRLQKMGGNVTQFIHAGRIYTTASRMPSGFIVRGDIGFDGQFYYRFAREPFSYTDDAAGIRVDSPAYRQQRILYPLLARLLAAGSTPDIPTAMLLINIIGLCVIGSIGAKLCDAIDRPVYLGLIFPLYAGFVVTLTRDLTEIVEIAFVLLGVYFARKSQVWAATIALSLSVLSKETSILVPMAFLAESLRMHIDSRRNNLWIAGLVPLGIHLTYSLWLKMMWASSWRTEWSANMGWPLGGVGEFVIAQMPLVTHFQQVNLALVGGLAIVNILILIAVLTRKTMNVFVLLWGAYLLLSLSLTTNIWVEHLAYMRATTGCVIFGYLTLLESRSRLIYPVALIGILMWAMMVCEMLFFI